LDFTHSGCASPATLFLAKNERLPVLISASYELLRAKNAVAGIT
jgi:hypothetical protein